MNTRSPQARGLYDPAFEHDACGIGMVVNISGRASHDLIEHGRGVLVNLHHRGAVGADETTGDGAGILFQIPHAFLAAETDALGFGLGAGIGWALAIVLMAGLRQKMGYSNVPRAFRGVAIAMIITGVMAMAFMGFAGMVNIQ